MFVRFFGLMGNTVQAELIDRICKKNICSLVDGLTKLGLSHPYARIVVL